MDRNAFLDRIALRLGRARRFSAPARDVSGLPPMGRSASDTVERFCTELVAVGGTAHRVRDTAALEATLRSELERAGATRIFTAARTELRSFALDWLWSGLGARAVGDPGLSAEDELRQSLSRAHVGITTVDFALADTGSVVVSARPSLPRSLSLLPSLHVALVRASQIVPDLSAAFAAYAGAETDLPSAVHVITGPSRTSDIENDLTIGVHGPAAVMAIVLEDSP